MSETDAFAVDPRLQRTVIALAARLGLFALLAYWCFKIFQPFVMVVVWGIILAVAFDPLIGRISNWTGGRRGLATTLLVLLGFAAVFVPAFALSGSIADGIQSLTTVVESGSIEIPPPPARIADWPVIGEPIFKTWGLASRNLDEVLQKFGPQIKVFAAWLITLARGIAGAALLTAIAIVFAVYLLVRRDWAVGVALRTGSHFGGERGIEALRSASEAIGTVAKGVIGVALVQATLAAIGLFLAGVPFAGLWTVLILVLAVAQLPPLVILAPAMLYVISTSDSQLGIVVFVLWSVLVSLSDAVLKPLFMGRGSDLPVPVILIGAIGGLILHGLIGLFIGAVVFSIGYRLMTATMADSEEEAVVSET